MATIKGPLIIGLYSPAPQSGKSTLGRFLSHHFHLQHRSFASPIKHIVRHFLFSLDIEAHVVNHLIEESKNTPIPKAGNKTVRELCQTLGLEWGRELIGEDLWVNALMGSLQGGNGYVIDDVRFPNEYAAVKAKGGEIWKIIRPDTDVLIEHPSEGLLEGLPFDRVLINDGTEYQLYHQLIRRHD